MSIFFQNTKKESDRNILLNRLKIMENDQNFRPIYDKLLVDSDIWSSLTDDEVRDLWAIYNIFKINI
jgi:hypothetical protein